MTEINLLPWREQKREQDKELFTAMILFSALIAALVVFLVYSYAVHLVNVQTKRNELLQTEIKKTEEQIKEIKSLQQVRKALVSRMSIAYNLQATRTLMVHMFDEIIKVLPQGVYITKLERDKDVITLSGFTESNSNISVLMTNIENNAWIQHPLLTEIKKTDGTKQPANNEFKLSFVLKSKSKTGDTGDNE